MSFTTECPECDAEAEGDAHVDEEFIAYECPNGHHFMEQA